MRETKIKEFRGQYFFLSNFQEVVFYDQGTTWHSVEHAYQAYKSKSLYDWEAVSLLLDPRDAKKYGKKIEKTTNYRENWKEINLDVMLHLLRIKFAPASAFAKRLLATGKAQLVEGNTWGDTFWGVDLSTKQGQNHLGLLLMQVREELRSKKPVLVKELKLPLLPKGPVGIPLKEARIMPVPVATSSRSAKATTRPRLF